MYQKIGLFSISLLFSTLAFSSPYKGPHSRDAFKEKRKVHSFFSSDKIAFKFIRSSKCDSERIYDLESFEMLEAQISGDITLECRRYVACYFASTVVMQHSKSSDLR